MIVWRCSKCGGSPMVPPTGNQLPRCNLCDINTLERRWEPPEWVQRVDASRARVRAALTVLNDAERELSKILWESHRIPEEFREVHGK